MPKPAHEPTKETRQLVTVLAIQGMSQRAIGQALGVSDQTIRRYYARELKAKALANAKVVAAAYQMAASGKNTKATIWWMENIVGMSRAKQIEISGPDGGPIPLEAIARLPADRLKALETDLAQILEVSDFNPVRSAHDAGIIDDFGLDVGEAVQRQLDEEE